MFRIILPADRAEPDMAAVAKAFGISVNDLMDDISVGIISRWFERGEGDDDNKPHQILASAKLGIRIDVDEHGSVHSVSKYGAVSAVAQPGRTESGDASGGKDAMEEAFERNSRDNLGTVRKARLDALLDEALDESFPASDPIAISFESPRLAARSSSKPDKK